MIKSVPIILLIVNLFRGNIDLLEKSLLPQNDLRQIKKKYTFRTI